MAAAPERDLIAFAERLVALLDQGQFVATYKYAVLLGLMDLCLEATDRNGHAPESVTTRQLAAKVIELYWAHTVGYGDEPGGRELKQNSGRQARIVADIARFRAGAEALTGPNGTLARALIAAPESYRRLLDDVEWTLILMPLPRLQVVGGTLDPFVYRVSWTGPGIEARRGEVRRYQRGESGAFDNLIRFFPDAGDHLVRLNGLLRPLIYRGWAQMVARFNELSEARLESFLFGEDRSTLTPVRPILTDLQSGRCFYCGERLGRGAEVDHFIPWARRPDNGIYNLVLADRGCNGAKRDFLAAPSHVSRWMDRNTRHQADLEREALATAWEHDLERTLGVARGIYFRLGAGIPLWLARNAFVDADPETVRAAFA